ncbi:MAG TPA: hypothetical protein VF622_14615 [Segetibacter sp.]|jgi:hypothetical protein
MAKITFTKTFTDKITKELREAGETADVDQARAEHLVNRKYATFATAAKEQKTTVATKEEKTTKKTK